MDTVEKLQEKLQEIVARIKVLETSKMETEWILRQHQADYRWYCDQITILEDSMMEIEEKLEEAQ